MSGRDDHRGKRVAQAQGNQLVGNQPQLFREFAPGGHLGRFVAIAAAAHTFQRDASHRVVKLAGEEHAPVLIFGNHADARLDRRHRMRSRAAIRTDHLVEAYANPRVGVDDIARRDRPRTMPSGELAHAVTRSRKRGRRSVVAVVLVAGGSGEPPGAYASGSRSPFSSFDRDRASKSTSASGRAPFQPLPS